MRLLTIIKIIGAVFLAGTPGSLELDRITTYEAFLQIAIGILLLCGEHILMHLRKTPNSSGNYHWATRCKS